jgi:hypothetical protein
MSRPPPPAADAAEQKMLSPAALYDHWVAFHPPAPLEPLPATVPPPLPPIAAVEEERGLAVRDGGGSFGGGVGVGAAARLDGRGVRKRELEEGITQEEMAV